VGELTFPDNKIPAAFDVLPWIEHHLLGADNGVMEGPAVAYYVMGDTRDPEAPGNEWRFAGDWPVDAATTDYHFGADGTLSTEKPAETGERAYTFDPADPCPTIGGCNLVLPKGPRNQNPIESRDDVLVFTTAALEAPVEVTGRVRARIWIASSAVDTDLSVRLCDVYPGGESYLMAEGMLRLRYRNGFERPESLEPDAWTEVEVDCWSTSVVFNTGHRIRVTVTSSNHPRFDVNPGTGRPHVDGGETVPQTNRISCGGPRASRIVLPVVRSE
jgi:putative CocE/NonD family hydrolase